MLFGALALKTIRDVFFKSDLMAPQTDLLKETGEQGIQRTEEKQDSALHFN